VGYCKGASMTTSNEHNNAPAVPQGWTKAIDSVPLESDGEVFIRFTDGSIGTGWATYWHGASNDFARWTFPDPDEFRLVSEWAKNVPASTGMHWTENEPVRLPQARTGRVYLAGPMTGISELNFPAFNQEAERLRAEGLQVLNPADHGIVDGADWADYLRHDIAGLASCERIHLLRGWTKSKGACLEMTIAKALGMAVTYQVDAEMEHSNAPTVPQGWVEQMLTDARHVFDAGGPETPQETRDVIEYVPSWIAAYRDKFSATKSTAPAVPQGFEPAGYLLHWPSFGGVRKIIWNESRVSGDAIGCPVTPVFKQSAATPATAPAQEVGLTDEERDDMACAVAAICTGTSSRTVAATAIEWTERALRAKGGK
jgi:hypothetical protein